MREKHQLIDDLCQPKGFFGSIGYTFKGATYRAQRYKTIVKQIKGGIYYDKQNRQYSYFQTAPKLTQSLCEKVESIKNNYHKESYRSTDDPIYKRDKQIFSALKNFNENMEYSTDTYQNSDTQHLNTKNIATWEAFINSYPEYSVIDATNQNSQNVNINGTAINTLRQQMMENFQLPIDTPLFIDDRRNEQIDKKIISTFAATCTIGKYWKNYVRINYTQQRRLVDMKAKKALEDLMIIIGEYFKKVPSADIANNKEPSCYPYKMRQTLSRSLENDRFGNCDEQAQLLYHLIRNSPLLADDIKKCASVVRLTKPDDHAFVIIGDINSDDALVLDPWLKFVDFKPVNEYRKTPVINTDKRRGFLGSKAQYLKFLASHEDGRYVKKNYPHQIERRGLFSREIFRSLSIDIHKKNRPIIQKS